MGDMSDLPNFHRSLLRRMGGARVVGAVLFLILSAIAWGFAEGLGQGLSVRFKGGDMPATIGAPYTLTAVVKNDEEKSVRVDLQAVMYARGGNCVDPGKHLTMSHPIVVNVPPNGSATTLLNFDQVTAPCAMSVGVKAFVNGEIDRKRFSITQDSGLSLKIL